MSPGGTYDGANTDVLENLNTHYMSPKAVIELKQETGATDFEIERLDAHLKQFMLQELKRLRATEP
jgi:hypothetical protein